MSKVSGVSGAASGKGDKISGGGDEEDEEEDVYLPPSLRGRHLTVNFPLLVPVKCLIGNCGVMIKNKVWTAAVNNLVRHMNALHRVGIEPGKQTNWCSVCHYDIGRQVATHACFKVRPFFVNSNVQTEHKCKECGECYHNWRGLSSHARMHKT